MDVACSTEVHTKKYITQIAPTLSQMVEEIPFPNGTESEVDLF
jgi:hypothetical protein